MLVIPKLAFNHSNSTYRLLNHLLYQQHPKLSSKHLTLTGLNQMPPELQLRRLKKLESLAELISIVKFPYLNLLMLTLKQLFMQQQMPQHR
jgi:hypothetical protein